MNIKSIKKPIAVCGTALNGLKAFYYLKTNNIDTNCFVQNDSQMNDLCGITVKDYSEIIDKKDYFYIIGTTQKTYLEIKKKLITDGLSEFKDFVYYEWIMKKIVFLHGNCHCTVLNEMLNSCDEFREEYCIYPFVPIYEMKNSQFNTSILEYMDVWIHQDIKLDNTYGHWLSDENLCTYFRNDITQIIIPNLYGMGNPLLPQSDINTILRNVSINNGNDLNGMFPYADKVVDKCVENNMNKQEIIDYCKSQAAISIQEIHNTFNKCIEKIMLREKNWNIKVSDFIKDNYQKYKLFYDNGHPTNIVLQYICNELLLLLGLDKTIIDSTYICLDTHEVPIYPIVKETLGLEYDERYIRKSCNAKKLAGKMTFEEYISEYLFWCHNIS